MTICRAAIDAWQFNRFVTIELRGDMDMNLWLVDALIFCLLITYNVHRMFSPLKREIHHDDNFVVIVFTQSYHTPTFQAVIDDTTFAVYNPETT